MVLVGFIINLIYLKQFSNDKFGEF